MIHCDWKPVRNTHTQSTVIDLFLFLFFMGVVLVRSLKIHNMQQFFVPNNLKFYHNILHIANRSLTDVFQPFILIIK